MAEKIEVKITQDGITRRGFLMRTAGAGLVLLAAGGTSGLLAACAKALPTADFTVASTVPDPTNHSHSVTIIGADVDNPPAEKTYTTTGTPHTHQLTLKQADFAAIMKGQEITVISNSAGTTPHTHTFKIKKPVTSQSSGTTY